MSQPVVVQKQKSVYQQPLPLDVALTDVEPNDYNGWSDYEVLENQVAGHQFIDGKDSIGLLKCKNGTILKPVSKPETGKREIQFYEDLQSTNIPTLLEMRDLAPKYYGTRVLEINGKKIEFLILENILEGIAEPCIIDIKVGKQTWDPLASPNKIQKEEKKYAKSKEDVGFCIPGFQLYKLSSKNVFKFDKEYGRKLNGSSVVEALRLFLNADDNGKVNQELLMGILTILRKIQKWTRSQNVVKLYSSSLLVVYDFQILAKLMFKDQPESVLRNVMLRNYPSFPIINKPIGSEDKSNIIPLILNLDNDTNSHSVGKSCNDHADNYSNTSVHHADISGIKRCHSHDNYSNLLDNKINKNVRPWYNIKLIDFAHAFPSDDGSLDTNYIQGIDNLVKIFESFLNF